jgi:hypothetical protein
MSGAASRRKGARAELAVAKWLRDHGWQAVTTRAASGTQRGDDLVTDTGLSWEVKDHAKFELASWVDQAVANANGNLPVVIHKRRGRGNVNDWYATMPAWVLMALMEKNR